MSVQALGILAILSPILMALAKLLEINPFIAMPWLWITAPWWYPLLLAFTTRIIKHAWTDFDDTSAAKDTTIRKDLH